MDESQYWTAFSARLLAYGLGNSLRGITITGNQERLRRLNEWLRVELPDLADDAKAADWMEKQRPLKVSDITWRGV